VCCLFQFAKKVVIPAMMELAALSALVRIDQYQGMRPDLLTVKVSYLSCYTISTRFIRLHEVPDSLSVLQLADTAVCLSMKSNAKKTLELVTFVPASSFPMCHLLTELHFTLTRGNSCFCKNDIY